MSKLVKTLPSNVSVSMGIGFPWSLIKNKLQFTEDGCVNGHAPGFFSQEYKNYLPYFNMNCKFA